MDPQLKASNFENKKMKVKIIETKPILPSTPPFQDDNEHELPLSHLDNDPNIRSFTFRYIRVYASVSTDRNPFDVIANSLSSILVHYYPLAGTLRQVGNNDQRLSLFWKAGQSLPLVHAIADCTLDSLDYDSDSVEQLAPAPGPEEGLSNPCILQVTVFKCGGYTLGTAVHHSLCDGMGATLFFGAASDLARGVSNKPVQPVWDRASLLSPRDPPRAEGPVQEFLGLEKGFKPYSHDVGPVVRQCFEVSDECLDGLKDALLEKCGLKFTTFEAFGAFVWRAKVRCSGIHDDENVKFAYPTNIRRTVKPPLPQGYWGNGCVPLYAQLCAKELVKQPLWKTAELIKKSKINANDEYVRSFIDFQELHYKDGITAGREVSAFTDWRHVGHSSIDFGWGGPVAVFPLSKYLVGSLEPCYFLPPNYLNAGKKDGFTLQVNLRATAMPAFREEMDKFSNKVYDLSA